MRKSKSLARELASDRTTTLGERHESVHVLRHLCEEADEKITSGDRDGLRVAQVAVRIAGRLVGIRRWQRRPVESEAIASSFARLAAAMRMLGRLAHAHRAFDIAFDAAPGHLKGDLYRRRAWIRIHQGRLPEALEDARMAVKRSTGKKEHAVALNVLGVALDYSGDHRAAARELKKSLAELDPKNERQYCGILVSYAIVLAKGSEEDARRALEICAERRRGFNKRHRMQRAKTWWLEGLLHERLGDSQAAWRALDIARRSLIAMKAKSDVGAIVANMARVSPQPPAIHQICHEALKIVRSPHPLTKHLRRLKSAAKEAIPQVAAALHDAASVLAPSQGSIDFGVDG